MQFDASMLNRDFLKNADNDTLGYIVSDAFFCALSCQQDEDLLARYKMFAASGFSYQIHVIKDLNEIRELLSSQFDVDLAEGEIKDNELLVAELTYTDNEDVEKAMGLVVLDARDEVDDEDKLHNVMFYF